jgi:periplasmic divalent cation tolerance protein
MATSAPDPETVSGTPFSLAYVTIADEEAAQSLATKLVESRLAGCVNIVPKVTSVYEWNGKIEKDSEALMMIKTRTSRLEELTAFVRKNHPYEVCEVISVPIQQGNPPYLKWLGDCVPSSGPSKPLKPPEVKSSPENCQPSSHT